MSTALRAFRFFDESRYPAGVTAIFGGESASRAAIFEEHQSLAYEAGWVCVETDGSENLWRPAVESLQSEDNVAIFVEELSSEGVGAFDRLLGIVSSAITPNRHVCVVVSGDEWVRQVVKNTAIAPVLVQNATFIEASAVPTPKSDFDTEVLAPFLAVTGGNKAERINELLSDGRLDPIIDKWQTAIIDGRLIDPIQLGRYLRLGTAVALFVEELAPESVQPFLIFLGEFSDALASGAKVTLTVTGEREAIEKLLDSDEVAAINDWAGIDYDL